MFKECPKCKRNLDLADFHKDKTNKSGLCCYCKICRVKIAKKAWQNPEFRKHRKELCRKWLQKNREMDRARQRRYKKTKKGRDMQNKSVRKWYHQNGGREWQKEYRKNRIERYRAYRAVQQEVKMKRLIKPNGCETCGKKSLLHAHHYLGYSKEHRLDIQWICPQCHSNIHNQT